MEIFSGTFWQYPTFNSKAVTVACDYCAHPHFDANNVLGGYTVVLSLLKPRGEDKSYHCLLGLEYLIFLLSMYKLRYLVSLSLYIF